MGHPAAMRQLVNRKLKDPKSLKVLKKYEKMFKSKDWYHFLTPFSLTPFSPFSDLILIMKPIILLIASIVINNGAETRDTPDLFESLEPNYTLRVTAKIITEDGKPLENADVHVGIENFNDFKDGSNDIRGKTNKDGKFSAEGVGRPVTTIIATKKGYYFSRKDYGNWDKFEEAGITGKYIPWDPVIELTLKKVGKPIPMIVRIGGELRSYGIAPAVDADLEWDLMKADWLPPHGQGKQADLILNFQSSFVDSGNNFAKMRMRFANKNDGLLTIERLRGEESALKFPREAPDKEYGMKEYFASIQVKDASVIETEPEKQPVGYFIRVRSIVNDAGEVVSANYGKITTPIRISAPGIRQPHPSFSFESYINPTAGDRNLEYDQHNNLAPEADIGVTLAP
jgi:hypothetical protein